MKPIRAIDLCGGAGGWACAARGLPIEIVAAYDWWDLAAETYALNHPGTRVVRCDLKDGLPRGEGLGKIDLILGGIPCQWLSTARGKKDRAGPEEIARESALLDSCLRIVRDLAPRWWCLEDVVQLRDYLPVWAPYRILHAQELGWSVQARRRLYVGQFPQPKPRSVPEQDLAALMDRGPYFLTTSGRDARLVAFGRRRSESPQTVRSGVGVNDTRFPTILNWSSRWKNTAPVILDGSLPGGRRELSFAEAARIQGFPEDYVFVGAQGDAWKMIANAVQITIAGEILRSICAEREMERERRPVDLLKIPRLESQKKKKRKKRGRR